MRRLLCASVLGLFAATVLAPGASASQLITWDTPSSFVAPDKIIYNKPPPGGPDLAPGLRVNVLLPDGYSPKKRYPVLFLLHGHGDRFDYWANPERGDVIDLAAGQQMIIVMPEGGQGWYANWWNDGKRADPAWENYYLQQLVPLVEKRLPILRGRRYHAIAGLSMGGLGALYLAEQMPGYFGSAASFSGFISLQRPESVSGFNTQGQDYNTVFGDPQGFYATAHNPTAQVDNLGATRLFVRVGDGTPNPSSPDEVTNYFGAIAELELHQQANDFVAAAQGAGEDVTYEQTQGIHDWPYWRAALASALKWGFFNPVPDAPPQWSYRTAATTGNAWGIGYSFSPAPAGIEHLSLVGGRTLHGDGSGTATLRTPSRCRFTVGMSPRWQLQLPNGWRRTPHGPKHRKRAKRACKKAKAGAPSF
jgi:S-formylglutathione hydrolase FrmB